MKKGFATLFLVIILGATSLNLAFFVSNSAFLSLSKSISSENSYKAKALANACAEIALEVVRENNSYTGGGNVSLGGNNCSYNVSNQGGNNRLILVEAVVLDVFRKIQINTNAFNPITISSWQEIP